MVISNCFKTTRNTFAFAMITTKSKLGTHRLLHKITSTIVKLHRTESVNAVRLHHTRAFDSRKADRLSKRAFPVAYPVRLIATLTLTNNAVCFLFDRRKFTLFTTGNESGTHNRSELLH